MMPIGKVGKNMFHMISCMQRVPIATINIFVKIVHISFPRYNMSAHFGHGLM